LSKLSHKEFTHRAIAKLRNGKQKSIHTVYSGFNTAFKQYFGDDPVEVMKQLAADGAIDMHPTKGGARIYLPGESSTRRSADDVIAAILG